MQRIQTTSSPDDLHALGQCLLDKDALSTEFDEEKKRKVYINAGLSAFTKCVVLSFLILMSYAPSNV